MSAKVLVTIITFATILKNSQSKTYENYSLFNAIPVEVDQLKFLQNLEKQKYIDIKFWKKPLKLYHDVQFMVSPTDTNLLLERVNHFKMNITLLLPNVQKAFDDQLVKRYLRLRTETYTWDFFHTLEDIYQWLTDLSLKFRQFVELLQIGISSEGRKVFALVIKNGNDKKQVVVEGGVHGNEWISIEFLTYLANQLTSTNGTDKHFAKIARNYNWYLIPILNPDGYDYNQRFDRLYRKNRHNYTEGVGVDLNRNFDYSFRKFSTSINPSDEDYGGPVAFSEPETQALKAFIKNNVHRLHAYVSVHSYGQKIVIPYADRVNHVGDYSDMANYGKQAIVKMYKLYGRKYGVGTFYDTMGLRISGNSASWVKKNFQGSRVFTLLLRDNGTFGYALPPNQIEPACKEALTGLLEVMTAKPRYMKPDPFSSAPPTPNLATLFVIFYFVILIVKLH